MYTATNERANLSSTHMKMFENLVHFEPEISPPGNFIPLETAEVSAVLDAQLETVKWLEELGAPSDADVDAKAEQKVAREAFTALNFDADSSAQKKALVAIKTPAAVQHLTGMLTAYDWDFIHQAKELRGYCVARIVEETNNPNANVRLKALQMLGNVTEVALFTERIEVTKKDASEEEIESRLRERLSKFITAIPASSQPAEVIDVKSIDAEIGQVVERRDA
jgi:hypothetical protein